MLFERRRGVDSAQANVTTPDYVIVATCCGPILLDGRDFAANAGRANQSSDEFASGIDTQSKSSQANSSHESVLALLIRWFLR